MSNELIEKRPDFLSTATVEYDVSELKRFVKPPRIKIVQAPTGEPYKPPFKDGDIVLAPSLIKLGDHDTPFSFTVIHFFPTWICMNPIQMKGQLKSIREFSMDPSSDVAKKCKAFIKEKCPENPDFYLRYSETLNFMSLINDNPELTEPVHIFFSRGEYVTGQKLLGDILLRKAPPYACRFRAISSTHKGKQGNWYGLDIFNDPDPWVTEEAFKRNEEYYKELKKLIDERSLELDTDDITTSDVAEATEF